MSTRPRAVVLTWLAMMLFAAGCADRSVDEPATPEPAPTASPAVSGPVDDPALSAAADTVDRIVQASYRDWYAGTVLDHGGSTMTVYRKPGSDLDAAVRRAVPGVAVVFRDAKLSRTEMQALVDRIMADTGYWRDRGVTVNGSGPLEDGSGVSVMTEAGSAREAAELTRHYGQTVVVSAGSAVAVPARPFRPSSGPASPPPR